MEIESSSARGGPGLATKVNAREEEGSVNSRLARDLTNEGVPEFTFAAAPFQLIGAVRPPVRPIALTW